LLTDFCAESGRRSQEIRFALEKEEWETARRFAHSLKGIAGNLEAMSLDQELFSLDKLQDLLKRKHDFKLDRLCSDIEISLSEFQEDQQFDDITMLALKRIT
jgi:HPt (histidine-containing phosphotransfer) domain-containing protein